MRVSTLLAIGASLLVPAAAFAQPLGQDIAFTTISKSAHGGQSNPDRRAITNAADYAALFGGQPPASPAVDFTTEDVLVVAMGMQPTGGYGTEIVRVVRNVSPTGPVVHFVESRPAPGTIVTMALTSPIHVVKLPKQSGSYSFVNDSAANVQPFTALTLTIDDSFKATSTRVGIQASGNVTVTRKNGATVAQTVTGVATAAEMKALQAAYNACDPATLPKSVVDPRVFIVAPPTMALSSEIAGTTHTFVATLDYYESFEPRVNPLEDAITAIGNRVFTTPASKDFDTVAVQFVGGFVIYSDTITLSKDGAITVLRDSHVGAPSRFWTDQATKAELQTVKAAFAAADVTTLPKTIPASYVPDVPGLDVLSNIAGTDYKTHLERAGEYGAFKARLQPLVDALLAIKDRVISGIKQGTVKEKVNFLNGKLRVGTYEVTTKTPYDLRVILAASNGKVVTVDGTVNPTAMTVDVIDVRGTTNVYLNLRGYPSFGGKILTTLKPSTEMKIIDMDASRRWLKVQTNGYTGWVYRSYVAVGN